MSLIELNNITAVSSTIDSLEIKIFLSRNNS